jgi:NADPH-dependent glutamate synthase beta subunit-like oxidoreductase/Pyruvate/2-oxoacid:ferredoxin oxidoreductase delta subunit
MVVLEPTVLEEVPVTSYSDHPTLSMRTGTWKYLQPRYEDKLPPCAHACPAGNDISKILALLACGDLKGAGKWLRAGNPLAATLGRVCPHSCQQSCNRDSLGGALAIHRLERFLGDQSLQYSPQLQPPTGQKVAVIGAGPAGITSAYLLAQAGHEVHIFDDKPKPGGFLRTGIPAFRLPKEILDQEIALVESVGVQFHQNIRVGRDLTFEDLKSRFAVVIVAAGLHASRPLKISDNGQAHVYHGIDVLERMQTQESLSIPGVVAVLGGGNTAIDVARSLLRAGSTPVIVYRRTEAEMPAIPSEIEEAKAEGVAFHFLAAPSRIVVEGGKIVALECQRMRLGEPDASGRRAPVPLPAPEFRLPVSAVVAAIGETADLEFLPEDLRNHGGFATQSVLDGDFRGVFVAGDVATNSGTVAAAVGSGRQVAATVDRYLRGEQPLTENPVLPSLWPRALNHAQVADAQLLNPAYFLPEVSCPLPEPSQASSTEWAVNEARRCLGCGTCNGCLNCYHWCPDVAIQVSSASAALKIDLEHCKGCGICVEECPRGAMAMAEVG